MTLPDYKTNDPRGWCGDPRRGAALGRPTVAGEPEFSGVLYVRQIRIDSGGYDPNGTYFGIGEPLFWIASEDGDIDRMERASDIDEAIEEAKRLYPNAIVANLKGR